MLKLSSLFMAVASLFVVASAVEAASISKCMVNGAVTYQQGPCPSSQARKEFTLEELNTAEKKRRAAAPSAREIGLTPAPTTRLGRFSCDRRQHCSQMSSCEEAKYFLANCPGVKMDGDGDGIPCEEHLCGH